jgi:23S rRNA (uracil1939-C5)-methyltransferase
LGCPLIGLSYADQLQKKRRRLVRAFANYPTLTGVEIPQVIPSPREFGYRGRVKLVVRKTRGDWAAGLYVPGTHRVIDISSCPVHPQPVNRVIHFLKRKMAALGMVPYDERHDTGEIRYLDLRYSFANREVTITVVTRHDAFYEGKRLARWVKERFPFVSGFAQNINESRGNVIWGEAYRPLIGRDSLIERLGDLELEFPATVFSQTNPFAASKLYQKIVDSSELKGPEAVVDLYCGVGPIALSLARRARVMLGVDDSPLAIAAAKRNARRNGISNCHFFAADVAEGILAAKRQLSGIDLTILNPPRKGIQPTALQALLTVNTPKIIYVSCDPSSLARDLDRLVAAGYGVRWVQPFDLFPQTEEVETAVRLQRP